MRNLRIPVLLTALLAFLLALPAAAQVCGDTIYHSTVLTADLTGCPSYGLLIGEDGVTLDLNGYSIKGSGVATGIYVLPGVAGVQVIGPGIVQGFYTGLGARSTHHVLVKDVTFLDNLGAGMAFYDVEDTVVETNGIGGSLYSILFETSGAPSDRNEVIKNQVNSCATHGVGIRMDGGADHQVISNFVTACQHGITLSGTSRVHAEGNAVIRNGVGFVLASMTTGPMVKNQILANKIYDNDTGIQLGSGVAATHAVKETLIKGNAIENSASGIVVGDPLCGSTQIYSNHLFRVTDPIVDLGTATVAAGNLCDGLPC